MGVVSLDGLRVPISNLSLMRPVPLLFGKNGAMKLVGLNGSFLSPL